MKKVFIYVCCILLLLFCFSTFAFADDGSDSLSGEITEDLSSSEGEIRRDSTVSVLKVSANQTSGLHSILLSLIGDYNPIVTDHTYTQGSGYTYHEVDIQPDWSWILTCALFIVVIFCFFRLLGALFSGRL